MKNSIESILIRGVSIASKFLLLGYLAKILSLADLGSFQLISYFVVISTTIFGLEYYNLSNRSIVASSDKGIIYKEHLQFFTTLAPLLLIIQVAIFIAIFPSELITIKSIFLVIVISLGDYISQEVYRYLMINKAYRNGNIQLIYKSLFLLILVLGYVFLFNTLFFEELLVLMVVSYILLLLFAYRSFNKNLFSFKQSHLIRLKGHEIMRIVKALWPFVVLVLFIKGIELSDKFIISKTLGLKEVGIYSFLFAMSSVLNVFIVSGFYIIYLPQLIESFNNDLLKFKKELIRFSLLTIGFSLVLALCITLGAPLVFKMVGKTELLQHMWLLNLLLIGFVFYNISLIPHLFLYVSHDEKTITWIMGFALIANISLNLILISKMGLIGAGYSFCVTYLIILLLKSFRGLIKWKKLNA